MEIFKKIKGFESYKISNKGNIINKHGRKLKTKFYKNKPFDGTIIKLMREPNIPKFLMVKRLIADNFICDVKGKNVLIVDLNKQLDINNIIVLNKTRNPR